MDYDVTGPVMFYWNCWNYTEGGAQWWYIFGLYSCSTKIPTDLYCFLSLYHINLGTGFLVNYLMTRQMNDFNFYESFQYGIIFKILGVLIHLQFCRIPTWLSSCSVMYQKTNLSAGCIRSKFHVDCSSSRKVKLSYIPFSMNINRPFDVLY